MAKLLIVLGLLALAFTLYAVVDCALTPRAQIRALPRWTWFVVVLLLPVVGGVLWFLVGSGRRQPAGPAPRIIGPDDDPEFLRRRGAKPVRTEPVDEDEWRRLEQELAAVDSDTDADDEGDPQRR